MVGDQQVPQIRTNSTLLKNDTARDQLIQLLQTTQSLKEQLALIKKEQRVNMEAMNDMFQKKTRDLTAFITNTAGAQHRPLRVRRYHLDQERHLYGLSTAQTERQLSDVEAAVEDLRNEVVGRRCRVNAREVEALVLQLSQAGRTIATMKGTFPALCSEIRTVGASENDVIVAEERFIDTEPARLDEQLKRCKQLTATLLTLKKLATVQEARSKTPNSISMRPNTPGPLLFRKDQAWEDPEVYKNRVMEEVKRIRIDHAQRMESIQDAELNWLRRCKFNREYETKKFEKALEMAERTLRRTDHLMYIEKRQRAHLLQMWNTRQEASNNKKDTTNLLYSESSSIESLPPPPLPLDTTANSNHSNMVYQKSNSLLPPPPPQDLLMANHHPQITGNAPMLPNHQQAHPSSQYSQQQQSWDAPPPTNQDQNQQQPAFTRGSGSRSTLPRRLDAAQQAPPSYSPRPRGGVWEDEHVAYGRQTPIHMMERSRSAGPQVWNRSSFNSQNGDSPTLQAANLHGTNNGVVQQQQESSVEKKQRLKEQYVKLQQLQKKQRLKQNYSGLSPPGTKIQQRVIRPPSYQTAKSSDV